MSTELESNNGDASTSLQDAVSHLESVAPVPSKKRHTNVSVLAKQIASEGYQRGVSTDILSRIIDILTKPNHLDQGTITTIIKNLYPQTKVPSAIITRIVCGLGPTKGKPSPATQSLLLRWILLVYECLEDQSHLSKLYSILFNYLDMISLRKPLCHLLSLITRRQHVKPFRIRALMELIRNVGDDERELMGFLRVYKNYYPEIITGDGGNSRKVSFFFKHPDPEWSAHLKELQEKNRELALMAKGSTFQVVRRGGVKRSRVEAIVPEVQTSRVRPYHTSLEELRNVEDFVNNLEKIDLPNQMVSALGDRLAQKYILLAQSSAAKVRLDSWLESFLRDELERAYSASGEDLETLRYVLSIAVDYVRFTKTLPTVIQTFIKDYLQSWDGRENRDQIFELLEYLPRDSFESLQKEFLSPLEQIVLNGEAASRFAILDFYSSLIRQWGVALRAEPAPAASDGFAPLTSLIRHVELLILTLLELSSTDAEYDLEQGKPMSSAILQFYTTLADLFSYASGNGNIRLAIPLTPTIYVLAFTSSLAQLSLLCSALGSYKSSFEASLTSQTLQSPKPSTVLYPPPMVGQFNGYIMDLCNLIWRNRGLNADDPNALGCLIPASTVAALTEYVSETNETMRRRRRQEGFHYNLPAMFSLSHNPALCYHSSACFASLEESQIEEGQARLRRPVTQKSLTALEKEGGIKVSWQDYRLKMLDWFDDRGSHGIARLMRSTMKALRKEG